MQDVDKEISEMKLGVNSRGALVPFLLHAKRNPLALPFSLALPVSHAASLPSFCCRPCRGV